MNSFPTARVIPFPDPPPVDLVAENAILRRQVGVVIGWHRAAKDELDALRTSHRLDVWLAGFLCLALGLASWPIAIILVGSMP
jgi:hypothetical protein